MTAFLPACLPVVRMTTFPVYSGCLCERVSEGLMHRVRVEGWEPVAGKRPSRRRRRAPFSRPSSRPPSLFSQREENTEQARETLPPPIRGIIVPSRRFRFQTRHSRRFILYASPSAKKERRNEEGGKEEGNAVVGISTRRRMLPPPSSHRRTGPIPRDHPRRAIYAIYSRHGQRPPARGRSGRGWRHGQRERRIESTAAHDPVRSCRTFRNFTMVTN